MYIYEYPNSNDQIYIYKTIIKKLCLDLQITNITFQNLNLFTISIPFGFLNQQFQTSKFVKRKFLDSRWSQFSHFRDILNHW